tara:strand:+ start:186 stop:575 length:390 start_codon:yes stop_codon:yes gene_type:complete
MSKNNIKIGSNKNFGIVFFIFFLIVSIFPLFKNGEIRVWSLIVGIIFLILGLTNSKILTPLNIIWFKVGIFLGNFVSPIVMAIVFFLVVTPTSLIMKLLGKDVLKVKKSSKSTYWIDKSNLKSKMNKQF